jgi:hypothetical protein
LHFHNATDGPVESRTIGHFEHDGIASAYAFLSPRNNAREQDEAAVLDEKPVFDDNQRSRHTLPEAKASEVDPQERCIPAESPSKPRPTRRCTTGRMTQNLTRIGTGACSKEPRSKVGDSPAHNGYDLRSWRLRQECSSFLAIAYEFPIAIPILRY